MRLGGWLRLWIVLVVIYGLVVGGLAVTVMPTKGQLESSRAWQALRILARDMERSTGQSVSAWDLKQRPPFKDMSDKDLAEDNAARAKRIDLADPKSKDLAQYKAQILALEQEHLEKVSALPKERLKVLGMALAVWAIPSLALLGLGHAVSWIYRGFKKATQ